MEAVAPAKGNAGAMNKPCVRAARHHSSLASSCKPPVRHLPCCPSGRPRNSPRVFRLLFATDKQEKRSRRQQFPSRQPIAPGACAAAMKSFLLISRVMQDWSAQAKAVQGKLRLVYWC